jgi:DNA helicase-2/ATP-dependent DNA helicase PcrA
VVSFTRIANSPRRGIGQTSLARVISYAASLEIPIWDAAAAPEEVPGLGPAAVKALRRFMDTMAELDALAPGAGGQDGSPASGRRPAGGPVRVHELIEAVLTRSGYLEALQAERTIEAQGRVENLEQLIEVGREFDVAEAGSENPLGAFLQEIALLSDADARSEDEGLVTLMTVHNAKGLEFPTVFIAGLEDGVFPHSRALDEGGLEEERRLFYVGVTRAMRELYLTHALRRAVFGTGTYGLRSRFLDEIPGELTDEAHTPAPLGARWSEAAAEPAAGARGGAGSRWGTDGAGGAPAITFRLGEDVVHDAFGEGVVTGVEPGGVIVVRFAGDGAERKLMAEYARVSRR